jgi:hypothetical protein
VVGLGVDWKRMEFVPVVEYFFVFQTLVSFSISFSGGGLGAREEKLFY